MATSATELLNREIPSTMDWLDRVRLWSGVAVCFALFWYGAGAIGLPAVPHMGGSLLGQPQPSLAIGAVAAGLIICTVIGRVIVGNLHIGPDLQFDGGVMAALVGMMAVVMRMGPVRYALFSMDDPHTFFLLAVELILMYFVVGVCWMGLQFAAPDAEPMGAEPIGARLGALVTHVVVMTACMTFLSRTDATSQSLAAVGISALLASMAAHIAFPVRCDVWFWTSPLIVGLVGYFAALISPDGLSIGFPQGLLGTLARPTPLAYASAGPAGAIFGFWIAHRWHHEQQAAQS